MAQNLEPITRETLIEEIVHQYPQLVRPLRELGIACIRCGEPIWGTLGQVAKEKGLEIKAIVSSLNRILIADQK